MSCNNKPGRYAANLQIPKTPDPVITPIPPAEAEENYYAQRDVLDMVA
jgi:hypothetical protein